MIEGIGLDAIAEETVPAATAAYGQVHVLRDALDVGGDVAFRLRGEEHVWTPETVTGLQHAVREGSFEKFQQYTAVVDDQTAKLKNLRGLFESAPRRRTAAAR